jgi:hypothetical protein
LEVLRAQGVGPIELVIRAEEHDRPDIFGPTPTGIHGSIYEALGGRHGTLRVYVEPISEPVGSATTHVVVRERGVSFASGSNLRSTLCTSTLASLDALSRCMDDIREGSRSELAQLTAAESVEFQRVVRVAEVLEGARSEPTFERIELTGALGGAAPALAE